jgi:hypothetical protein
MNVSDMQHWMLKISEGADGDTSNFVFVMRQVLTKAYTQGFEDGHHAASKDDYVCREIERSQTTP